MLCSKFVRGVLLPKRLPIGRWISVGAAQESEPITMLTYPGSRVLQLSRPESGNVVTENILNTIKSKLDLYEGLPTVTCVFFTSQSTEFFSSGLETRLLDEKNRRKQLITVANQVSDTLVRSTKETIAICGGDVDSSVFGVLANSKFRLGTETTRFQMRDLLEGRLPLGGAIAHHLGKTSDKGYALARYLGVSGRVLSAYDLYTLGLVTHIVQQDSPEDALAIALAHGSSNEDSIKAVQAPCINTEGVQQLLDTMHIFMGVVDMPGSENEQGPTRKVKFRSPDRIRREMTEYYENNRRGKNTHKKFFLTKQMKLSIEAEIVVEARRREDFEKRSKLVEKPGDFHLLTHPVWDRVLLVPTQETPLEKYFDSDEARERVEDLDDVLEEILQCFSGEDVAECRRRVEEAARSGQGVTLHGEDGWSQEHWAVRALACWNSIEPSLVSDWFALAKKSAEAASLADAYKLEEESA